jgi:hypothetical protein
LIELDFANEQLIEEVLTSVGMEFQNTNGPNFHNILTTAGMVLLEGKQQAQLMQRVSVGIVKGIEHVVYELAMEEKYQRAAMRALAEGMMYVGEQFSEYAAKEDLGGATPGGDAGSAGFWEPPRFDEAVCCMRGMECWTGDFAAAAGRAQIMADIAKFQEELVGAKELYDELNAENEREAAAERAIALADARDAAARLTNQIRDAQKRETKAEAALAGLEGEELVVAQAAYAAAQAATTQLQADKRAGDEAFAFLNKEDAEGRAAILDVEFKQKDEEIAVLKAEVAYEKTLLDQYKAVIEDATKTEEERKLATEEYKKSTDHIVENEAAIETAEEIKKIIEADKNEQ